MAWIKCPICEEDFYQVELDETVCIDCLIEENRREKADVIQEIVKAKVAEIRQNLTERSEHLRTISIVSISRNPASGGFGGRGSASR